MIDQREPTLDELLNEPIIQQVMLSDGVRADDIRYLMQTANGQQYQAADDAFPVVVQRPQFQLFGCAAC